MSKVFVCGDTHGDIDVKKLFQQTSWNTKNLTKEDILIPLGDWGAIWFTSANRKEKRKDDKRLRWWVKQPYTLLTQLGNHENYDLIEKLPIIEKFGGKVYEKRVYDYYGRTYLGSLYIMIRGEVYNINNKTFFSMGGAKTFSINERQEGSDIWKDKEIPNEEELKKGIKNLKKYNFKIDYIITHTCPIEVGNILFNIEKQNILKRKTILNQKDILQRLNFKTNDKLTNYFQELINKHNLEFEEWHFGHWHLDKYIKYKNSNFYVHYNNEPYLLK